MVNKLVRARMGDVYNLSVKNAGYAETEKEISEKLDAIEQVYGTAILDKICELTELYNHREALGTELAYRTGLQDGFRLYGQLM